MNGSSKDDFAAAERVRQGLRLIVGLGLLGAAGMTDAAWVAQPSVSLTSSYDDNVRLQPEGDPEDEAGISSTANLQTRVSNVTEITEIAAIVGAGMTQYSGVNSFEDDSRQDFFGTLSANRRMTRGSMGLTGTYRSADVLRGIQLIDGVPGGTDGGIPEPGPDDEVDPGGDPVDGSSGGLTRRNSVDLSPSYLYQATLRTSVSLAYRFSDDTYSNVEPGEEFQDFRTNAGTLQLSHAFTERDTVWLDVTRAWFEPEVSPESDSWQASVNWQRQLTVQTRLTLGAGAQRTENDLDDEAGSLYNVQVDHALESGTLTASVERAIEPNSYGDVIENERASLRYGAQLSNRWSAAFRVSAYRTDTGLTGQVNRSQDYFDVSPQVRWRIAESWSLTGAYSYTWVDRERNEDSAASNGVTLGLIYAPPRQL